MTWIDLELRRAVRLLALITLAAAAAATVDHETMLCASDDTPMCGRSQGEYLLFKNECDLRKAQRENLMGGPLFDVALHNCLPSCELECEGAAQPVCGVSVATGERKSFRNRCEMMRTSCLTRTDWLVHKWGVCAHGQQQPKQPAHTVLVGHRKRRRPIPCTNVYRPVCASYAGVKSTFSNECLVNAENIRTGRNWRIVSEGLCGEDSTKMKHSRKWKPKTKPKPETERSKRSYRQANQLDDFEMAEDAVQIFAPSTFHTQFISKSGIMEKSYSLPARQPYPSDSVKRPSRRIYGSSPMKSRPGYGNELQPARRVSSKPCVFSNEPVCGSFNGESRTFDNVCALMEFSQTVGNAWTILYEGRCRRCDKPCPSKYSPVCAVRNGISYTIINECFLERVRCKDPNSNWKITHKGECILPADEVAHNLPPPSPKPSARIPHMLYAVPPTRSSGTSNDTLFTTTFRPRSWGKRRATIPTRAAPTQLRMLRKFRRPTPTPTARTTPTPTAKDLSNRKIRKIEPIVFQGYKANSYSKEEKPAPIKAPFTAKAWSPKDSWQTPQLPESGKDAYHKRPHHKKVYSEKYPQYSWQQALTTPRPIVSTTTPAPLNTLEGIANAQLLDLDMKSAAEIFGEIEADTEILFMMDSTAATANAIEMESTTNAATKQATTRASTTEATVPSTAYTATAPPITTTTTTTASPLSTEDATEYTPEQETEETSTDLPTSSIFDVATSENLDQSTADDVEASATTAVTTTTKTNEDVVESDPSTTSNVDYLSDEPMSTQSDQTSIYGLDKNSLIMRLLRARSGKNMVL
ncbi:hypothetical protein AWZ03_005407 [Drosophila navojoa]|uniref:Kazal-like domain-containing protein n=1 Tax=Drosophila navojoa TaxID=7232 RepID=A0A484BJ43_DRONA|nr:uncharacterized protein LOC108660161 [Drosophila navojoa]TDG48232.1 hypothetical protein AWZ03_005407 [Drosophila navojoa]